MKYIFTRNKNSLLIFSIYISALFTAALEQPLYPLLLSPHLLVVHVEGQVDQLVGVRRHVEGLAEVDVVVELAEQGVLVRCLDPEKVLFG